MPQFYRTEPVVPQPINPLESVGQALTLKSMMNRQKLEGQAIQEREQDLKDEQMFMEALKQTGGHFGKALELTAGKISPRGATRYTEGYKKQLDELRASDTHGITMRKDQAERLAGIIGRGIQMSPQEYETQYDNLIAAAKQVNPNLQLPQGRIPQAALQNLGLGLMSQQQMVFEEEERRKKKTFDVELPGKQAEAQGKQMDIAERQKFGGKTAAQVTPGQDVPLPPAVEAQRARLARAGRSVVGQQFDILTPAAVKAMGLPQGTVAQVDGRGKVSVISQPNAKMTGAHSTALRYLLRGAQASDDIMAVEDKIGKMGVGGQTRLKYAPNIAQTEEGQLYKQAARSFTEARLRKDSGAAIPQYEYDNDERMYFAQPGDDAKVLTQKRKARAQVLEGIAAESGPAFEDYFGQAFEPGVFVQKYAPQDAKPNAGAALGGPKVGDVRKHQGATYKFDGKQWVKQAGGRR